MSLTKRATIYLDADLHRAVRMKAAEIEESVSELVNAALRRSLAEHLDSVTTCHKSVCHRDDVNVVKLPHSG